MSALSGIPMVRAAARGSLLLSTEPISLWGGLDPASGRIIDRRHDRHGESVAGRIFAFPSEKGSSTGSAVLLELIRSGHAPVGIVTCRRAPAAILGAIVADELYGRPIPVVALDEADFARLCDGERLRIGAGGTVERLDE